MVLLGTGRLLFGNDPKVQPFRFIAFLMCENVDA
jgi:hypothetical protein